MSRSTSAALAFIALIGIPATILARAPEPIELEPSLTFIPITVVHDPSLDPSYAAQDGPRTLFGAPPSMGPPVAIAVPQPRLVVVPVATPRPAGSHSLTGMVSWYCSTGIPICFKGYGPSTNTAAAGPALRAAICGVQSCTSWRGMTVYVEGEPVVLRDWCQCHWHESIEKVIDLYHDVWVSIGKPSVVDITW